MGASHGTPKLEFISQAAGTKENATRRPRASTNKPGLLGFNFSSKLDLHVRCEQLRRQDVYFAVMYTKLLHESAWTNLGLSDRPSPATHNPFFHKVFHTTFRLEVQRQIRIEIYRTRDALGVEDLASQGYMGCSEMLLIEAMMARKEKQGWLTKDLLPPRLDSPPAGRLCIFVEEDNLSKSMVAFTMLGKGIRSTDMWKLSADPYCVIHRTKRLPGEEAELEYTPIYRTPVRRKTGDPVWPEYIYLSVPQLCENNVDQAVVIEVQDWFRVQKPRHIGDCILNFKQLQRASRGQKPLKLIVKTEEELQQERTEDGSLRRLSKKSGTSNSSKDTRSTHTSNTSAGTAVSGTSSAQVPMPLGTIILQDVSVDRTYSFLDYIRGGLNLRVAVAIDFTRSNTGPQDPKSMHYLAGSRPNPYMAAIHASAAVLHSYDKEQRFPLYGFGAKIPPSHSICSDCFALNGDFFHPEVTGTGGIIKSYIRALHVAQLHGPSRLHKVIRMCANLAEPFANSEDEDAIFLAGGNKMAMTFFVLLILTDGCIDDQQETINELVKASELPMAVVIVDVSKEGSKFLHELPKDVQAFRHTQQDAEEDVKISRKVVHHAHCNFSNRPHELVATMLAEIPREVVGYYDEIGVKPRDLERFEDESGEALKPTAPDMPEAPIGGIPRSETKLSSRAGTRSRMGTKQSLNSSLLNGSRSRMGTKLASLTSRNTSKLSLSDNAPLLPGQIPFPDLELNLRPAAPTEQEMLAEMAKLSPFLRDRYVGLQKEASNLGYEQALVKRILQEGVPDDSFEFLVDNIVNVGFGNYDTLKDAALSAVPEDLLNPLIDNELNRRSSKDSTASGKLLLDNPNQRSHTNTSRLSPQLEASRTMSKMSLKDAVWMIQNSERPNSQEDGTTLNNSDARVEKIQTRTN